VALTGLLRAPTLAPMRWGAARGFTLVELLVALGVLGLVMAGVASVLDAGQRAYLWGAARVEAQQSARVALERMARELREAGYDPQGVGIQPIVAAEPARLVFQRDLNGNGRVDPTRERVTYLLRGTVLRRDAGGGAQPVIEGVRRLTLGYLDGAGLPAADPRTVAAIRVEIEVGLRGPVAVMTTEVALRNRVP
jgi:prepilin-type N-terminal cleavage/methylation domain-containing protein